jgi:predicted CopG family antitoxin
MASALARPTTITVSERTRRRLEAVKGQGESFDDLIQDLLEDSSYDDKFYAEIEKRWTTESRIPGVRVLKRAGLELVRTKSISWNRRSPSSSGCLDHFKGYSDRN